MAQVPQSPGLTTLPNIESVGFVGAQPAQQDMSFTKYGKQPLENIKQTAAVYTDYQEEQRKKAMDARVADAASEYYKRSMELLVGKNGALLQKEYDVVKGYNGKSFTQYWGEKIDSIADVLVSKNADPELRQAFLKSINGYRSSFYGQLLGHEGSEGQKYAVTSYRTKADVASDQISRGQNLTGAFKDLKDSLTRIADLEGKNVNDKTVKADIHAKAQSAFFQSFKLHIDSLLAEGKVDVAMEAAKAAVSEGTLDGNSYNAIQVLLKDSYDKFIAKGVADRTVARIEEDSTASGALWAAAAGEGVSDDVIDTALGKDHPLYGQGAEKDAGRTKEESREVRRQRGMKATDRLIVGCGGVLNATYFLALGSEARAEEVRKAWEKANGELDPADQRPLASFTWADAEKFMTPEEKAKQKRIAKSYNYELNRQTDLGVQDFYRHAKLANPNASEDVLISATAQAKTIYDTKKVARMVKQDSAMAEIANRFSTGDMDLTGVDMTLFSEEQKARIAELRRVYTADVPKFDPKKTVELLYDPKRLMTMSETDFILLQTEISRDDWRLLKSKRDYYKQNGGVGTGDVSPGDIKTALQRWSYKHPDRGVQNDPKAKAVLEKIAYLAVANVARTRAEKDPLTQKDIDDILEQQLSITFDKYSHTGGLLFSMELKPGDNALRRWWADWTGGWLTDVITSSGLKIEDMSGRNLGSEAKGFLERAFQLNPNNMRDGDYTTLVQMLFYDPTFTVPGDALPEVKDDADVLKLYQEYEKINGKPPSEQLLGRIWFLKKAGIEKHLDRFMGKKTEIKPRVGSQSYSTFYGPEGSYNDLKYLSQQDDDVLKEDEGYNTDEE